MHKGVNQRSIDVTKTQQQRHESPTVTLTWHASKYKEHKLHQTMYLMWNLCTLYLLACQVKVTVGDSGLCCCVWLTSFEC